MFYSVVVARDLCDWNRVFQDFLACHRNAVNVGLHLFTTPLGLLAFFALLSTFSFSLASLCGAIYLLTLFPRIPLGVWMPTTLTIALLLGLAYLLNFGFWNGILLLSAVWILQELAQRRFGEQTRRYTYMGLSRRLVRLAEQTFYLLPLVLASFWRTEGSVLRWIVPRNRVFFTKLAGSDLSGEQQAIDRILEFVSCEKTAREHTTRWWQEQLEPELERAFTTLSKSSAISEVLRQHHGAAVAIDLIPSMNEICVEGAAEKRRSDSAPCAQGPWAVFPFSSVYQCLVELGENGRVSTHFPLNGKTYHDPETYTLNTGEALLFDYNREPHYATIDESIPQRNQRVTLKTHYLVYPKWLGQIGRFLGQLSASYNARMRKLSPNTARGEKNSDCLKRHGVGLLA